ncbi:histidinol dehydrogenase [Chryseobacterium indoltheticum]|uniref:histidinol dehydrogenase n=1 Tax=Chryseobacterium indoltheticum TaxID=254 RepID=UPI001913D02C|nr:histidinol dehydrogenase [Chryseobacterium indoltheticum]QQQ28770.1 histidinol dehydrogenase [Chryseobacterium indoltheticum]
MKINKYPSKQTWSEFVKRPIIKREEITEIIVEIFSKVKENGDQALIDFNKKFDQAQIENINVSEEEIDNAKRLINGDLKKAIQQAKENITKFHASQITKIEKIETTKGVICWRENRAIEKVGIYIPGGTAPLFSTVLMLAIPAQLAGCKEIILCTPPDKNGNINPAILYTAQLCGVKKIFKTGGAQSIAAMTFGTESVPKVYKIFGPGNQFVVAAKDFAQKYNVAIDMPAGPSEVLIIADEKAIPEYCAADLLSQAEHGSDSQVIFISTDLRILNETIEELKKQIKQLPRNDFAQQSLNNSHFILLNSADEALEFSNLYAPEHLILAIENFEKYIDKIRNAGSVFLGNYSCESAGDYASGTNHTLPTNGFAKNYSGVSLDSFVKKITFQNLSQEGLKNLGKTIEIMAEAEGLLAHKNAVSIRLKQKYDNIKY